MERIITSLMSGGYEPDDGMDVADARDIAEDEARAKAHAMTNEELYHEFFMVWPDGDSALIEIYTSELDSRVPVINVQPYSTLADYPDYDPEGPDERDQRKEQLESMAEPDELPF